MTSPFLITIFISIAFFATTSAQVDAANMAIIPEGFFQMGDFFGEGRYDELPVHDVYISAFYMDKYEVSNEDIRKVMQWAYDNGKISASVKTVTNLEGNQRELLDLDDVDCQINFVSGNTFVIDNGKTNYPCIEVTWFGALAYCNYKSDMEGLGRCIAFSDWSCNWSSNGYRLPTESEWEKAARGGNIGTRFPGPNTNIITHSAANYNSFWPAGSPFYSYDNAVSEGYHPDYTNGVLSYTSPVGIFAANDYGLYDMAGNVWEWNYDWYADNWYSNANATNMNTRGPESGYYHVVRGGSWGSFAFYARCSSRVHGNACYSWDFRGFRCVRLVP